MRNEVYQQVLKAIVSGQFTPGTQVKDTEIAGKLGTSRTPVRETLLRLEQEGFLESRPGCGFKVRGLERGEVEEIYPILWTLESLALRTSDPLSPSHARKIAAINEKIDQNIDDSAQLIELDNAWHTSLVSGCTNKHLISMISHLKTVVLRYEYHYMRQAVLVDESVRDHSRMIELLEKGDIDAAGALLEEHWKRSMNTIARELGE